MARGYLEDAQRAIDLPWPQWELGEERVRALYLLGVLIPVSTTFLVLDLRFEGLQLWSNLGLRLLAMVLLSAGFVALLVDRRPETARALLSAGLLAWGLFLAIRYGQGLGLDGFPGHLPTDLVLMVVVFLIPAPVAVRAGVAATIAGASAIDYVLWKGMSGMDAVLLAATLGLTWAFGFALSLGRRSSLRQRYLTLRELHMLRSSIPICAWCNKIRDDAGSWTHLETYLRDHADMLLTHGVCPTCVTRIDPEMESEDRASA